MFGLRQAAILAAVLALAPAAAAAEEAWITLAPPEQNFAVEFPTEPAFSDIAEMQGGTIALFHDYRAFSDEGIFLVDVVRFTPAERAARSDIELVATAVEGVAGSDCEASAPRSVASGDGTAHEVIFRCPDEMTMRARFHVADAWLYQVGAGGGPGFADGADATRFLDSFRLVAE